MTPVAFFQLTVWVFWLSEGDVICSRQKRKVLLQVCQSFFSDPECCGYLHTLREEPKWKWVGSKNWKALKERRILGYSKAGLQQNSRQVRSWLLIKLMGSQADFVRMVFEFCTLDRLCSWRWDAFSARCKMHLTLKLAWGQNEAGWVSPFKGTSPLKAYVVQWKKKKDRNEAVKKILCKCFIDFI